MADPATADSIEQALFDALRPHGPGPTGNATFKALERFAGEPTADALAGATGGRSPALLLALEGDDPVEGRTVETLAGGLQEAVSRASWRVYVVVQGEPRGDARATKGDALRRGALALAGVVKRAVIGLAVEGLADDARGVSYLGTRPVRIERGDLYAYAVRVAAEYPEGLSTHLDTSVPLARIDVDLTLSGEADAPPDPTVSARVVY